MMEVTRHMTFRIGLMCVLLLTLQMVHIAHAEPGDSKDPICNDLHKEAGKRVHNFHVEEEWTGSFVVLGTTGSGKTTLIKYVYTHLRFVKCILC
jgi:type IV secretory pathway VirB4 component